MPSVSRRCRARSTWRTSRSTRRAAASTRRWRAAGALEPIAGRARAGRRGARPGDGRAGLGRALQPALPRRRDGRRRRARRGDARRLRGDADPPARRHAGRVGRHRRPAARRHQRRDHGGAHPRPATRSRSWRRSRPGSTSARWARTSWRPSWCCRRARSLTPVDLGAAAACGHPYLDVRRKPRVAIFPTGTELVEPGTNVKPGDIIEFNSLMLAGQVTRVGRRADPPADHARRPTSCSRSGSRRRSTTHDLVLVNAGSSAGSEDYTSRIVGELGELVVHGVRDPAGPPGHPGRRAGQADHRHPRLPGLGRPDLRAVRQAADLPPARHHRRRPARR